MRKKLLCILLTCGPAAASASVDYFATDGVTYEAVVVKFSEKGLEQMQDNRLRGPADPDLLQAEGTDTPVTLHRMFVQTPRLRNSTDSNGLSRYFQIPLPADKAGDASWINNLMSTLDQQLDAETIYPSLPPEALNEDQTLQAESFFSVGSGSPVPAFIDRQGYLKAPDDVRTGALLGGVNALAAHKKYPESKGKGVTVLSNEIGRWNTEHINLPQPVFSVGYVKKPDDHHNTSSVGIMAGKDLGYGILGIAHQADFAYSTSLVVDLASAINRLKAGDVVQIGFGVSTRQVPQSECYEQKCQLPMESQPVWFDTIKSATDRGIHVIQAATNGGTNLDHPGLKGKFDRHQRDSGSIIVAAVCNNTSQKASFSNYGSRVDSASWGCWNVASTTVGDAASNLWNGKNRQYTGSFSGTSAANPIVAGVVASISATAQARGQPLTPLEMRKLLTESGTPLGSKLIGTQPDMLKALDTLTAEQSRAEVWDPKKTYATPCNRVSYQGKEWLNGWWTVNNKPGSDGMWGVWRLKEASNMHGSCQ